MMISKYQALHERKYLKPHLFSGEPVSASLVEVIPGKVDGDWRHSWHWPDPSENWNEYVTKVAESIKREQEIAIKRLGDLRWAERMLEQIEPEEND